MTLTVLQYLVALCIVFLHLSHVHIVVGHVKSLTFDVAGPVNR